MLSALSPCDGFFAGFIGVLDISKHIVRAGIHQIKKLRLSLPSALMPYGFDNIIIPDLIRPDW
jgi:hypothetical protein